MTKANELKNDMTKANELKNDMKKPTMNNEEIKAFFIDLLVDIENLKSLIYNGSDVAAYRNSQKISDKIKDKVREL